MVRIQVGALIINQNSNTMLQKIRNIINLEISGDATEEQISRCFNMIADYKVQFGYVPNDIAEWELMAKYEYPQC